MAFSEIPRFTRNHRQRGFTLIEALAVVIVASVLVTAAVPAVQDFVIRTRMSTEVNTFVASLYLARSDAVKQLRNVNLCPVDANGNCEPGNDNWEQGWKVYYTDAAGAEVAIQQNAALPARFTISGSHSNITYTPVGQANAGNYKFCDTDNIAEGRKVEISNDGRVYVVVATDCATYEGGAGEGR